MLKKKTAANKGKVCLRRKRDANGKMRCASFGIKEEQPKKKTKARS